MSDKWISNCATCEYYKKPHCKRYPPQVLMLIAHATASGSYASTESKFPDVQPHDRCGEYQPERQKFRNHMQELENQS